ncbi:Ubiquitin-like protein 7 [Blomia tropicalis]|nr:Ubiquitin-like protein 7 [Blomia tropicalis]
MDKTENFVLACNKVDSLLQKEFTQVNVPTFNCTVEELATIVSDVFHLEKDRFNLTCFGNTLDSTKSLDSYGINNGIIVYLTKKKEPTFKEPTSVVKPTQNKEKDSSALSHQNQEMCIALKSALLNPMFRKVLENLTDPEKQENLMAVNPELRSDPTLFGILSDLDLLNAYINRNNIKRVLQRYPYFLEVVTHISATFHEESSSGTCSFHLDNLDRSAYLNYSIDAPSDEEMDESETSSISSTNTQTSSNRLTEHPNHSFSSMLMQAYQNRNTTNSQQPVSRGVPIITEDMLREALTTVPTARRPSATNVTLTPTSDNLPAAPAVPVRQASTTQSQQRSTAQILIGWAPQLRQMHELGITDDIVAIQALEATNGDVQAALNIIFSDNN